MEWGGGAVGSGEEGLSRFAVGSGVTWEEGRFPEQEKSLACYTQRAVDRDLHFVFLTTFWRRRTGPIVQTWRCQQLLHVPQGGPSV